MKGVLSAHLSSCSLSDQLEAIQLLMKARREGLEVEVVETAEAILEQDQKIPVIVAIQIALLEWDC